ncbi:MAG TPA: PilN domain-containing protein [Burkholderiaceae bacterium]|jgi:type IV pilus assembly protein PilN
MIRINLLPHREAKRKQNKSAFYRLLILAGAFSGVIAFVIWLFIQGRISDQNQRNDYIKAENKKLDTQIAEIATLKDEIAALKARQQAVEDLQSDRNQPVYLLDELVKQIPEGVYLRSFKQEGQRVALVGTAQSNERVSNLLRNLTYDSPWLEKPDLVEIKASTIGQGRDVKRVFDFTMNVAIKRPRDTEKQNADGKGAAAGAVVPPPAASAGASASSSVAMPADKSAAAASKSSSDAAASAAPASAPKKP